MSQSRYGIPLPLKKLSFCIFSFSLFLSSNAAKAEEANCGEADVNCWNQQVTNQIPEQITATKESLSKSQADLIESQDKLLKDNLAIAETEKSVNDAAAESKTADEVATKSDAAATEAQELVQKTQQQINSINAAKTQVAQDLNANAAAKTNLVNNRGYYEWFCGEMKKCIGTVPGTTCSSADYRIAYNNGTTVEQACNLYMKTDQDLTSTKTSLDSKIAAYDRDLQTLNTNIKTYQAGAETTAGKASNDRNNARSVKEKLATQNNKLNTLKATYTDDSNKLGEIKTKIQGLHDRIKSLEGTLASAKDKAAKAKELSAAAEKAAAEKALAEKADADKAAAEKVQADKEAAAKAAAAQPSVMIVKAKNDYLASSKACANLSTKLSGSKKTLDSRKASVASATRDFKAASAKTKKKAEDVLNKAKNNLAQSSTAYSALNRDKTANCSQAAKDKISYNTLLPQALQQLISNCKGNSKCIAAAKANWKKL